MTARDLLSSVSESPWVVVLLCLLPVAGALVFRFLHGRAGGAESPWRYLYSVLVYVVCVPGILALTLTAYSLFFVNENMLDVNLLVYILPIVTMALTLGIISRSVKFDQIPGTGRLSGLMLMWGMTFLIIFVISRTRIWIVFGGSIMLLLVLTIIVFVLLKWGAHMTFKGKSR